MAIGYTEIDFLNGSAPALNATNLNKMDEAIKDACDLLDAETVAGRALVEAANADAQRTLLNVEDGADVTANNAPKAHTASHKHGGTDEIATATPAPNAIPKADGSGKLDGWITGGAPTATQTASRIPLYNAAKGINADGISFPATQAASADANTLDDYEEGTASITFVPGTSGTLTTSGTYNILSYVKIGKLCYIWGHLQVSAVSSPVGTLRITGLPFVANNGLMYQSSLSVTPYELNTTPTGMICAEVLNNTSTIAITQYNNAGVRGDEAAALVKQWSVFVINGFYEVA